MNNTISSVTVVSIAHPKDVSYPILYSFIYIYIQMTAESPVSIGMLLNSQMTQLHSICFLIIELAVVLC